MMIESLRLNHRARNQLITLKRKTGIGNWNVLCRWALCVSLSEAKRANPRSYKKEGAIEIAWRVFSGPYAEIYVALIKQRLNRENKDITQENIQECLRVHVHRGIGYLSHGKDLDSIVALVTLATQTRSCTTSRTGT